MLVLSITATMTTRMATRWPTWSGRKRRRATFAPSNLVRHVALLLAPATTATAAAAAVGA
jgi:hypothetical protein